MEKVTLVVRWESMLDGKHISLGIPIEHTAGATVSEIWGTIPEEIEEAEKWGKSVPEEFRIEKIGLVFGV